MSHDVGACPHCARFHPPDKACAHGTAICIDECDEWPTSAAVAVRMAKWAAGAQSTAVTTPRTFTGRLSKMTIDGFDIAPFFDTGLPITTNTGPTTIEIPLNRSQRRAAASRKAKR
jgi:hypothetical protein